MAGQLVMSTPTRAPSPVEQTSPHLHDAVQRAIAQGIEFFVVSSRPVRSALNLTPFGHSLPWIDFASRSYRGWDVGEFLGIFNTMNGVAFGPRGIPMPKWVMIDLALMPSAIVIATVTQDAFSGLLRSPVFGEIEGQMVAMLDSVRGSGYTGPIPVGGYCAAPSAVGGVWVGWSLWSLVPGQGIGLATKALALGAYRAERLHGITQYDNAALRVHARFGRLRIVAATVPVHNAANSFVYESDLTVPAAGHRNRPSFLLAATDTDRQREMQSAIENRTAEYYILPPGRVTSDHGVAVPILEVRGGRAVTDTD